MNATPQQIQLLSLAEKKLACLNSLYSDLQCFVEHTDVETDEINTIFDRQQACLDQMRENDRLYASAVSGIADPHVQSALAKKDIERAQDFPEYARIFNILANQMMLVEQILKLIQEAGVKVEKLSDECRNGLRSVQQRKWISLQAARQPLMPGSLLNYSEAHNTCKSL